MVKVEETGWWLYREFRNDYTNTGILSTNMNNIKWGMGGGGGGGGCTTIYIEKTNKQISVLTCPPLEVKMPLKLQTGPENINVVRITSIKYVSKMQ